MKIKKCFTRFRVADNLPEAIHQPDGESLFPVNKWNPRKVGGGMMELFSTAKGTTRAGIAESFVPK